MACPTNHRRHSVSSVGKKETLIPQLESCQRVGALKALRRSPPALARNPVLLIPALLVGLLQLPQLLLGATSPLLASLVSVGISLLFIFIMPFFQAGIIGMADEALQGRTRLRTFIADGKAHYVTVLIAYILLSVIGFALFVGFFIFFFIISFVLSILVPPYMESSGLTVGAMGLVLLVSYLPTLLLVFFVQFYGQAIVLDDESSMDGIRRSVDLVRRNLSSTFGYTVVGTVFGGGLGLVLGGLSTVAAPQSARFVDIPELAFPTLAAAILVIIVLASAIGSFLAIFSVAFYREMAT